MLSFGVCAYAAGRWVGGMRLSLDYGLRPWLLLTARAVENTHNTQTGPGVPQNGFTEGVKLLCGLINSVYRSQ